MKVNLQLTKSSNAQFYGKDEITLPLEQYIKGAVAQEVGNSDVQVCAAQAIAARTNVYQYILKDKKATDSSSSFQAFAANKIDNPQYDNVTKAVELTAGMILSYNGKPVTPASFSASNGGKMTSSQERWGGVRAWLISKEDPYDLARTHGKKTGHGVGMSQTGAKEMAAQGFNYQEILNFYYPNTTITSILKEGDSVSQSDKILDWCMSKKGAGYVWGATGYILTQSKLDQLINQYPSYVSQSKNGKWLGKQVFDCASFVRLAMKQGGASMVSGASSQWKKTNWQKKGTIDTLPKDQICCLYRESPKANPMQHTGVYLGNGQVMDDRGSASGVIQSSLSSYPWTHWGIPTFEFQEVLKVLYKATVAAPSGNSVRMRAAMSTDAAVLASIPLDTVVDVTSESGEWSEIMYNNEKGYMQSKFLRKGDEAQTTWYVRIDCESENDAKAIAKALGKATAKDK